MSEHDPAGQPLLHAAHRTEVPRRLWIVALCRLWLLRPLPAANLRGAAMATVIVGTVCLAFWMVIDRWESQPDPQFFAAGVPLLAWYALAIVGLAGMLRRLCRARAADPAFAAILAVTMGLMPGLLLFFTLGSAYLQGGWFWAAAALVGLHAFLYLARGLRAVGDESPRPAAIAGVLFIALFIWATDALNVIPDLWSPAETQAAAPAEEADDAEALMFGQAALIDQSLANIRTDGTAKPRAFFVGFAGVGDQKVFTQEIQLASAVIGDKYGVDSRALSLINDERDLQSAPLASVSGLKYALKGLASRMNLDRDVLFLSISSHGSEDAVISVSNSQLPLEDLSSDALAQALHESGIKWRVIVLSACYAGAFIDALRDPQTIVIAAAAADRTSFGCSNDSDLTYFGEAFYRDALPASHTLREAFEKAKKDVSARERAEHIDASNPQAYFGKQLEDKLAAFAAR